MGRLLGSPWKLPPLLTSQGLMQRLWGPRTEAALAVLGPLGGSQCGWWKAGAVREEVSRAAARRAGPMQLEGELRQQSHRVAKAQWGSGDRVAV